MKQVKISKTFIVLTAFLCSSFLYADLGKKKQQAEKKRIFEKNYLVFGMTPNSKGGTDVYISSQLLFSKRLSAWFEFEKIQSAILTQHFYGIP